uniref:Lipase n=1 Tax=Eptatretus burgeri TaxID=7764 RepID=A0A8C4QAP8_EPTBU
MCDLLWPCLLLGSLLTAGCHGDGLTVPGNLASPDPEIFMNASQMIISQGYPNEEYEVTTADGFILSVSRIPHGVKRPGNGSRPPVLLQHGLLADATNWVCDGAEKSLGFLLADAGFDVWLANSRGNTWSRKHRSLSPSDVDFWAWSFDEMAAYDLPAVVDFVLKVTGNQQLFYVGHSQGTTIGMAAFSSNASLAKKIRLFFALAPVATVGYSSSPMIKLAKIPAWIMTLLFGERDFAPQSACLKWLSAEVCDRVLIELLCENVFFLFSGFNEKNLNTSQIPVYTSHCPAGTSVQNMRHWRQAVLSRKFKTYDYGSAEMNRKHYNQPQPPLYSVKNMKVPIAVWSGGQDWLADPLDVNLLLKQLNNLVFSKRLADWEHLDFIWGLDAPRRLYSDLIKLLRKYSNTSSK